MNPNNSFHADTSFERGVSCNKKTSSEREVMRQTQLDLLGDPPLEITRRGRETKRHRDALGHRLAELGATRAAARADRTALGWTDGALACLIEFARDNADLNAERVREFAHGRRALVNAPDARAWGCVFRKAQKGGLIEPTGDFDRMDDPACHKSPIRRWRSKVYTGAAA
jgi:hypothetical protein